LEFGYGSPEENDITLKYRETYVQEPYMAVQEQLQRAVQRFAKPEESFEGEAILVFNSLSWERDAVVEFQFPEIVLQQYRVIDLATNEIIPAYRNGYRQYFVARNLPSLGYKKIFCRPQSSFPGI
jgi:alpha-mannosidase